MNCHIILNYNIITVDKSVSYTVYWYMNRRGLASGLSGRLANERKCFKSINIIHARIIEYY